MKRHIARLLISLVLAIVWSGWAPMSEAHAIVGGVQVQPGEIPWQVEVRFNDVFNCGGVLVDLDFVLTAAHCVHKEGKPVAAAQMSIVAGRNDRNQPLDAALHKRSVSQIIPHPEYSGQCCDYDVALLRLSQPLEESPALRVIQVLTATEPISAGVTGIASGWGLDRPNGTPSSVLMMATLTVSEDNFDYPYFLANDADNQAICFGDSGGPFVLDTVDGPRLAGIASFGGCQPGGGFARVSSIADWVGQTRSTPWVLPPVRQLVLPMIAGG
jgi:secreted trypsin-like serine protease